MQFLREFLFIVSFCNEAYFSMHTDEKQEPQSQLEEKQIKLCHIVSNTMKKKSVALGFVLTQSEYLVSVQYFLTYSSTISKGRRKKKQDTQKKSLLCHWTFS